MSEDLEQLRYPIGKFTASVEISFEQIKNCISQIEALPAQIRESVTGLSEEQLDTPYRPGGWTLRQVVHHLADSHMNAYIRCKLAVTEENPTIMPYKEDLWAEFSEAKQGAVEVSLNLLAALHNRWALFLRNLKEEDFDRTYMHPEYQKQFALKTVLGMYAWHGEHHLQHVLVTKKSNNW